ncbi:hypothetical protein L1887_39306 [Cichorium endivia]|nr:hypothetical protein L1887_39306 [Cichorium endivia]
MGEDEVLGWAMTKDNEGLMSKMSWSASLSGLMMVVGGFKGISRRVVRFQSHSHEPGSYKELVLKSYDKANTKPTRFSHRAGGELKPRVGAAMVAAHRLFVVVSDSGKQSFRRKVNDIDGACLLGKKKPISVHMKKTRERTCRGTRNLQGSTHGGQKHRHGNRDDSGWQPHHLAEKPPLHNTPATKLGELGLTNQSSSLDIRELQESHLAKLQPRTLFDLDWTVIPDLLYPTGATTIAAAHWRHYRRNSTSPTPLPSQQPSAIPRQLQLKSTDLLSLSTSPLELITLTSNFRS